MKKVIVSALIAVVVAGSASAQERHPRGGEFRHHQHGFMQQLDMTDKQKTELKGIHEDFRKQMSELKKNEDITVREWKGRMETIRKEHKSKIDNVLTDEQKAAMEKMKQDRKGKMKQKGKHRMEYMKKELNLTPDQEAALKQQRSDMHAKLKALREDKSLTEEQKRAEMKKFREQQHQSLKSILTEEQINKLQQKKHPR